MVKQVEKLYESDEYKEKYGAELHQLCEGQLECEQQVRGSDVEREDFQKLESAKKCAKGYADWQSQIDIAQVLQPDVTIATGLFENARDLVASM